MGKSGEAATSEFVLMSKAFQLISKDPCYDLNLSAVLKMYESFDINIRSSIWATESQVRFQFSYVSDLNGEQNFAVSQILNE